MLYDLVDAKNMTLSEHQQAPPSLPLARPRASMNLNFWKLCVFVVYAHIIFITMELVAFPALKIRTKDQQERRFVFPLPILLIKICGVFASFVQKKACLVTSVAHSITHICMWEWNNYPLTKTGCVV